MTRCQSACLTTDCCAPIRNKNRHETCKYLVIANPLPPVYTGIDCQWSITSNHFTQISLQLIGKIPAIDLCNWKNHYQFSFYSWLKTTHLGCNSLSESSSETTLQSFQGSSFFDHRWDTPGTWKHFKINRWCWNYSQLIQWITSFPPSPQWLRFKEGDWVTKVSVEKIFKHVFHGQIVKGLKLVIQKLEPITFSNVILYE